jgi:pSer/pThr/pTyr-binding forkhead associated (FHA) protein
MVPAGGIAFYVEGTSRPVFSCSDKEFVVGRKVGETAGPLLDLSPFGGYHLGLSRRHALIRKIGHGYEIMDLSSSIGTWLNDERLAPNKTYPLANGSQLRLARMRFFVAYRSVLETNPKI